MTASRPRIAILGAGRAGCSFHENLQRHNFPLVALWTRSDATASDARAAGFPAASGPLPGAIGTADLVLLAVSDGAVAPLARELAGAALLAPGAIAAHLSGSQDLSPLEPLRANGQRVGSIHPLVSLATRHSSLAGGACAIEAGDEGVAAILSSVADELGLFVVRPRGDRARYHAAACLVGNYPQVLMEAAVQLLVGSGLTRDEARRALGPLLVGAAQNAAALGGPAALTGPVSRGDADVVRRHLEAIAREPGAGDTEALYRAAGIVAAAMARAKDPRAADEITRLLGK